MKEKEREREYYVKPAKKQESWKQWEMLLLQGGKSWPFQEQRWVMMSNLIDS